jgi:hypothetical protein
VDLETSADIRIVLDPWRARIAGFVDGRSKRRIEPLAEAVPHY